MCVRVCVCVCVSTRVQARLSDYRPFALMTFPDRTLLLILTLIMFKYH